MGFVLIGCTVTQALEGAAALEGGAALLKQALEFDRADFRAVLLGLRISLALLVVDPSVAIAAAPPESDQLTEYDRAHLATYLKLLDAHTLHVDWKVTARTVLALDTEKDSDAARGVYDAHLARARWMTVTGYMLTGAPLPRFVISSITELSHITFWSLRASFWEV